MKIISTETIKPSTPTPSHLKTFKLSLIDQLFPAFQVPLLLFYNAPLHTPPLQITTLKSILSDTLSQFYPLAGRCIDEDTVSCTDQGIPFTETHVNSHLTEFLASSHKLDYLTQLLPPRDILKMVPLAFQVNVFACGGVVIGCLMLHKLLDMSSLGTFFQYWAAITAQRYHDVVDPALDPIIKAFPSCPVVVDRQNKEAVKPPPAESRPVVVLFKNFRFTKTGINDLKAMAATETHPNPTTFETVTGFVWESILTAACDAREAAYESILKTTGLSISINMRPRTNPPLPSNSMGNCVTDVFGNATKQGTFQDLVGDIHNAILKAKSRIEAYQEINGLEKIREDRRISTEIFWEGNPSVYHVSSWCKLGLSEADFGFGKPNWIIPNDGKFSKMLRNMIFLTDYYDDVNGDGIEVWLFLKEKEMQVLENNPRFLKFASPY